jgi:hypothetical protein
MEELEEPGLLGGRDLQIVRIPTAPQQEQRF